MNSRLDIEPEVRTYGGWRLSKDIGILGVGLGGSSALVISVMVMAMFGMTNPKWYLYLGPPFAAIAAGILLRWDHETLADRTIRKVRWFWANASRYTTYSAAHISEHIGRQELPGMLGSTRLLDVDDGWGHRFGLVHHQRMGLLTAVLPVHARTTSLVDAEQVDTSVAGWGSWLADLGLMPMVAFVAVTVETAPEPGDTLAQKVTARIKDDSPIDAQAMLVDLLEKSPHTAADVDTRVAITFNPAAALVPLVNLSDQVNEVSRLLTSLESSLAQCGVSVLERLSAPQLAGVVTTAFSPDRRGEVNRLVSEKDQTEAAEILTWEKSGPAFALEEWDHYEHNGAYSISYVWADPPRQSVTSNVLARLVSPGRWPRRVTMLYRAFSAGEAADELERQVNAVTFNQGFRNKRGMDERARDHADRMKATQAAREEAQGAGLVRMCCHVTTTVTDKAQIQAADADVMARAQQAKIRLKRMNGAQAAGFAFTLPAGLHPFYMKSRSRK